MKTKWTWFLVATLLIFIALYFWIKLNTAHGINEINPQTGIARLTEECENRHGFILTFGDFFICN